MHGYKLRERFAARRFEIAAPKRERRGGRMNEKGWHHRSDSTIETAPSWVSTLNFNRRFDQGRFDRESLLALRARVPEEIARRGRERESAHGKQFTRNSPRRAFSDWIHSYLSPRQSVPDCNPSPRFLHTTATAIATTTPFGQPLQPQSPFPHSPTPASNISRLLAQRREREPPSLTRILNIADSSVFFLWSFVFFLLQSSLQSYRDPLNRPSFSEPPLGGI